MEDITSKQIIYGGKENPYAINILFGATHISKMLPKLSSRFNGLTNIESGVVRLLNKYCLCNINLDRGLAGHFTLILRQELIPLSLKLLHSRIQFANFDS